MSTLYEETRHLHHACEAHPVGQRMADGTITAQEWADWLAAFRAAHLVIDPVFPDHLGRVALLNADLSQLPAPRACDASQALASRINNPNAYNAAAYVLHGAHRRGGRVLASTMGRVGFATTHVVYTQPAEAEAFVKALRGRVELAESARAMFSGLLAVMDDIEAMAQGGSHG